MYVYVLSYIQTTANTVESQQKNLNQTKQEHPNLHLTQNRTINHQYHNKARITIPLNNKSKTSYLNCLISVNKTLVVPTVA
jgi:hypothetical protein